MKNPFYHIFLSSCRAVRRQREAALTGTAPRCYEKNDDGGMRTLLSGVDKKQKVHILFFVLQETARIANKMVRYKEKR